MLKVKDVTISYGKNTPIHNLSFDVEKAKIACILGLSGVGKSTLAKAICGIKSIEDGEIFFDNMPMNPKTHNIGYVSQNYGLYPWKNVFFNLNLGAQIKKKNYEKEYFDIITNELGISHLLKKYPSQISGGEKQRVALGRSFLLKPDILVLDEAFSALDEVTRGKAHQLFLKAWEKYRATTLIITHSIDEAIKLSDIIFILRKGEMKKINLAKLKNEGKDDDEIFLILHKQLREENSCEYEKFANNMELAGGEIKYEKSI